MYQGVNINTHYSTLQPRQEKALKMVKNERMGGYVPKWEVPESTPKNNIQRNLSHALDTDKKAHVSNSAIAYYQYDTPADKAVSSNKVFGFKDIIDMINPLQHIPLVNTAYRALSGDEIKPISKIIGGGLFAGPLGAASGLINVIVEKETGKNIAENALAMTVKGEKPSLKSSGLNTQYLAEHSDQHVRRQPLETKKRHQPEEMNSPELINTLLAFTDMSDNSGFSAKPLPNKFNV